MSKFVKTSDEILAAELRETMICIGYEKNTGEYVFINEGALPIKFEDNTKLHFSDVLMF